MVVLLNQKWTRERDPSSDVLRKVVFQSSSRNEPHFYTCFLSIAELSFTTSSIDNGGLMETHNTLKKEMTAMLSHDLETGI